MKKNISAVLVFTLIFTMFASGCGAPAAQSSAAPAASSEPASSQAASESAAEPAAESEAEKVTLRLLTRYTGTDATTPVFQEMMQSFMEKYPNVTIQDDSVNEEAAYNNKMMTSIATGDLPNMWYMPGVMAGVEYAKNGITMDVTPLMEDKEWFDGFTNGSFETWNFTAYGVPGYYGVPFSVGVETFYYNTEIFANAGIEKVPETIEELYDAIDKLKAYGVVPWSVGAKETWRAGHILNFLFYKNLGVDKAKEIGSRSAKWTDPDVVETLNLYMDLKNRGAFQPNYEGVTYDEEKNLFFGEKAAMVLNGSWFVGDCVASPIADKLDVFTLPYFSDKPQFKGDAIVYPQGFVLSGKATGAERDMQIEWIKHMTNQEQQTNMVASVQRMSARGDIDLASLDISPIFVNVGVAASIITNAGGDTFDFDPLQSMVDRTRNSLIGMSLGTSPEEAAAEIQAEIDKNS